MRITYIGIALPVFCVLIIHYITKPCITINNNNLVNVVLPININYSYVTFIVCYQYSLFLVISQFLFIGHICLSVYEMLPDFIC